MAPTPEPKKVSAMEFAKEKLQLNPEATYADIKAQAKFEGIALFPVVYGRAKALLGLVPTAPYGSKSKARRELAEAAGPSRPTTAEAPRVQPATAVREEMSNGSSSAKNGTRTARAKAAAARTAQSSDSLEAMISDLRSAVQERDRYRAVLEKVAEMIRAELAE